MICCPGPVSSSEMTSENCDDVAEGQHVQVLQNAMNDWMKYTCINFRPATASDTHKIKFVDGDG